MNDFWKKENRLKHFLYLLFLCLMICLLVIGLVSLKLERDKEKAQQEVTDMFGKLREQLEFNGLNDQTIEMATRYSKLFDGYGNVIVTGDDRKIKFALNDGYLVESDQFNILADPWQSDEDGSDIGYILDGKNGIRYSVQFGITSNITRLKEISVKNPLVKTLYERVKGIDNTMGDKIIKNKDGTSYVLTPDSKILLDYAYISSKKLSLFSMYDIENQYRRFGKRIETETFLIELLQLIAMLFGVSFWVLLTLWVNEDAIKYFKKPFRWVFLTALFNLVGYGIYRFYREKVSESDRCPYCGRAYLREDAGKPES